MYTEHLMPLCCSLEQCSQVSSSYRSLTTTKLLQNLKQPFVYHMEDTIVIVGLGIRICLLLFN